MADTNTPSRHSSPEPINMPDATTFNGQSLRAVHFIDVLGPGGKERQLVELLKGFAESGGCESLVVCMSENVFYREITGIPNARLLLLSRAWKFDPMPALRLCRIVRAFRASVVIAWDFMTAIYALPAALLCRVRYVNHLIQDAPETLPRRVRFGARLTFPFSDLIVANSQAGLDAYGVRGGRGIVIHNGFDPRRQCAPEDRDTVLRRWNLGDRLIVGMVSTFRPWKDQPTLIRAAERILRQRSDVVFVLVGDGETLESCRALVPPDLADSIRFTGAVYEGLESLVSVFDIGVLATFTEGISNSVMEYMAFGKPVVATDGGGTRELLLDGQTGFLVPPSDPRRLADTIVRLLDDPPLRTRMGKAGHERIAADFSLGRMVARHRAAYQP